MGLEVLILFAIIYFWYNVNGVIFKTMQGEVIASVSTLLGIITWMYLGKSVLKYVK